MTLDAIKDAISGLPADDRTALMAWLLRQDLDDWEFDVIQGNPAESLLHEAAEAISTGRIKPIDEFLHEASLRARP